MDLDVGCSKNQMGKPEQLPARKEANASSSGKFDSVFSITLLTRRCVEFILDVFQTFVYKLADSMSNSEANET